MGTFSRGNKPDGNKKFGFGGRSFGGGNRGGFGGGNRGSFGGGRPQMHKATCSDCGKECEIPFRPTGDRPVFCSACFEKQGGGKRDNFGGNKFDRPRFDDKQMHEAVCAKCGTKCRVPFKPMPGKSVFCDACFGKNSAGGTGSGEKGGANYKQQFEMLNTKLDKILHALAGGTKEKEIKEVVQEKKEVKEAKKSPIKAKISTKKSTKKKK
ncbi:MAG: hypothetical protein NTW66_01970 [Candidatus Magasanikbacteria bacterium]|nr:hypothetical protein [Candidatus Magasanikbacteria bacterium]